MTYADAYRLAHILDEQMQRLLDGDGVEQDALAEAHKIAVLECAAIAPSFVAGTTLAEAVVATIKRKPGAKRKRQPVIQDDPCPRCKRTGQAFYVRASGQRTAYCVECSKSVPPGSNVR